MAKKKAKRKPKKYIIDVRVDVSYNTEIEVKADNILEAGKTAMKMAREEALSAMPGASYLNHADVMIEDGEEVED